MPLAFVFFLQIALPVLIIRITLSILHVIIWVQYQFCDEKFRLVSLFWFYLEISTILSIDLRTCCRLQTILEHKIHFQFPSRTYWSCYIFNFSPAMCFVFLFLTFGIHLWTSLFLYLNRKWHNRKTKDVIHC